MAGAQDFRAYLCSFLQRACGLCQIRLLGREIGIQSIAEFGWMFCLLNAYWVTESRGQRASENNHAFNQRVLSITQREQCTFQRTGSPAAKHAQAAFMYTSTRR